MNTFFIKIYTIKNKECSLNYVDFFNISIQKFDSFISFGIVIINLFVFCFNLIKLKTKYDNKIKHKVIMIISIFMIIIFFHLFRILQFSYVF